MAAPDPYTHTVNPVMGCLNGCWYCYARGMVTRFAGRCKACQQFYPHPHDGHARLAKLPKKPVAKGKRPRLIFIGSACDLWSDAVLPTWRLAIWQHVHRMHGRADGAPCGDFAAVCTKRPDRIDVGEITGAFRTEWKDGEDGLTPQPPLLDTLAPCGSSGLPGEGENGRVWPRALWVGTTITGDEHRPGQAREERRFEDLRRAVPAERAYLSIEPLLGPGAAQILADELAVGRRPAWVMLGPLTGQHEDLKGWHDRTRDAAENTIEMCKAWGVPIWVKEAARDAWPGIEMRQERPECLNGTSPPAPLHRMERGDGNCEGGDSDAV